MQTQTTELIRPLILLALLAAAACTDLKRHKVYNFLIITGFGAETFVYLTGTRHAGVPRGLACEPYPLVYIAGFLLVLCILYRRKMLGAADVKLYALVGCTYPDGTGLRAMVYSVLLAGAAAVLLLAAGAVRKRKGAGRSAAVRMRKMEAPELQTAAGLRKGKRPGLPMGVFLFLGTAQSLLGPPLPG